MELKRIYTGVKERMPGGRVYNRRKKLDNDDFLKLYRRYYTEVFFRGVKNVKIENYISDEEYFEFANLLFPTPKTPNDFKTLISEAPDLLFAYRFANSTFDFSKIENFFDEGPYEISEKVSLKAGDVVIDCGANMGFFSNIALAKACEVYAFEPGKAMQTRYLSKYKNKDLHIENYALSDSVDEEIEFTEVVSQEGSSYISGIEQEGDEYINNRKKNSDRTIQYKVKTITLDNWVLKNNISKIDFIKADIEGAERRMLRGGVKTLHDFAPKLSICTYHFKDDPIVLENIIRQANPDYVIEHKYKKLYAYIP